MSQNAKTPAEPREPQSAAEEKVVDLRGRATTAGDRSEHRRHAWLYEDLLN